MDLAKLKAKAAFYITYVNELENQEPFNNRDFINTVDINSIHDDDSNKCEAFTTEQSRAIKRAITITAQNDNGNRYLLDTTDDLDSESVNIEPIIFKINYLTEDK